MGLFQHEEEKKRRERVLHDCDIEHCEYYRNWRINNSIFQTNRIWSWRSRERQCLVSNRSREWLFCVHVGWVHWSDLFVISVPLLFSIRQWRLWVGVFRRPQLQRVERCTTPFIIYLALLVEDGEMISLIDEYFFLFCISKIEESFRK